MNKNLSEIILYEYIVYRNKMNISQIKLMYHVLNKVKKTTFIYEEESR